MKREDVKNKIPGITEEQLNWIMQENGNDVNREKAAATALQAQLDNANAQLKTAQDGLKAFEGKKKPEEYEAELTKLQADMKAQADGFAFDSALNTAILGKKGRSVKAVRGGRFTLGRQAETIYTAELLDANSRWSGGMTEDEVRSAFSLITKEWVYGDN